jgi:hypothetical protein
MTRRHGRRGAVGAAGLLCALLVLTTVGCGGTFGIGGGSRKVVSASLYFRPVLCTISSYGATATGSAGQTIPLDSPASARLCSAANAAQISSTPPTGDSPTAVVVLPYYDNSVRYVLGPADLSGSAVAGTRVVNSGSVGFQVELTLTPAGAVAFGRVASERYPFYAADPSKPSFRSMEAIELNGTVVSDLPIQAASFNGAVVISGSTAAPFTKTQATGLSQHIDEASGRP